MRTSHTCNSTDPRPNILFLQADDFARATISAYQSHLAPIVKTPHIDKLAAEGAIFDRSFVTNSLCAPSRTVILRNQHSVGSNYNYYLNHYRSHHWTAVRKNLDQSRRGARISLAKDDREMDIVIKRQGREVNVMTVEVRR